MHAEREGTEGQLEGSLRRISKAGILWLTESNVRSSHVTDGES